MLKKIELDANGKGTDVGAAVEYLLSLQNNYGCSVRWLNRREDREPHKTQTIELEYAVSGFDENCGQSYRRMLSQAHIVIYPKPQGAHITFTYPDEHAQIYLPFWDDLYKLMGERDILANTAPAPKEKNADTPKTPTIELSQWQKGKAGRKSDKGYDAAFEMIENGTPQNEARDWYFRENNLSLTDQQAIKNFNDALRRRKMRVIAK